MELVWDSADELEREGCAAHPFIHNGLQDEEFEDVNSTLYMINEEIQETLIEMNDQRRVAGTLTLFYIQNDSLHVSFCKCL